MIIAASHEPIQRLVDRVGAVGDAIGLRQPLDRVLLGGGAATPATGRRQTPTAIRPILRTRLGSCRPTDEPLSQHTTDSSRTLLLRHPGSLARAGGSFAV